MAFQYRERPREKMEKREQQQAGDFQGFIIDTVPTYAVKKGDNFVRILPPTFSDNPDHYGIDVHVHYQVGPDKASVLCLQKMRNQPCPICEARAKAERAGDDDLANDLKATKRVLVWMIDRREEKKGPQAWAMAWTVDRDIVKISRDPHTNQYYLIDHPDEGYDISFDKSGDQLTTKYTGLQLSRRSSSVDPDFIEYVEAMPLPDILRWRSYDEIKSLFEGGPSGSGAARSAVTSPRDDRGLERDVRGAEREIEKPRETVAQRPLTRRDEQERTTADNASLERDRRALDDATHDRADDRRRDAEPERREPPREREPERREPPREREPERQEQTGQSRAAALRERFARK